MWRRPQNDWAIRRTGQPLCDMPALSHPLAPAQATCDDNLLATPDVTLCRVIEALRLGTKSGRGGEVLSEPRFPFDLKKGKHVAANV